MAAWSSSPVGTYTFSDVDGVTNLRATKDSSSGWNSFCRSDDLGSDPSSIDDIVDIVLPSDTDNFCIGYSYMSGGYPNGYTTQYDEGILTYGLYFRQMTAGSGDCRVMKNNSTLTTFTYTAGVQCQIKMEAGSVKFYNGATLVHTITETVPSHTYFMIGSANTSGKYADAKTGTPTPPPSSDVVLLPPEPAMVRL